MINRRLRQKNVSQLLPPPAALIDNAVAHFNRCMTTSGSGVGEAGEALFQLPELVPTVDGQWYDRPLFDADNITCFPRHQEDIPYIVNGGVAARARYPPFALEGLYYLQLLKYYETFPKVCGDVRCAVFQCLARESFVRPDTRRSCWSWRIETS